MLTIHMTITRPALLPEAETGEKCFWVKVFGLMAFFCWR